MTNGQCKCGAVQFTAASAPVLQLYCHCADCRAATGADYVTTAFFPTDSLTITGALLDKVFTSANGNQTARRACTECGTFLFDTSDAFRHLTGIFTETIAAPFRAAPSCHMWVESRLSGLEIGDGLPEYPRGLS